VNITTGIQQGNRWDLPFMLDFKINDVVFAETVVLPISSVPLRLTCQQSLTECTLNLLEINPIQKSVGISCVRSILVHNTDHLIYVYESPGELGIGGKIWDSTFVLIDYLYKHASKYITNRKVIELGSGTGVTGISSLLQISISSFPLVFTLGLSLAFLDPLEMVLTDINEVVPLLSMNIQLNQLLQSGLTSQVIREKYKCVEYLWGTTMQTGMLDPNDSFRLFSECLFMVASDVIYYPEGYRPLLETLEWWLSLPLPSETCEHERLFILAHRHRHPEDGKFFEMVEESSIISINEISRSSDMQRGKVITKDVRLFILKGR
jgi:hypothetical protein